jgi:hypothetical protein
MCGIIAILLLAVSGLFGYSFVATTESVKPPLIDGTPVVVQPAAAQLMTPTPTVSAVVPTQAFACAAPSEADDLAAALAFVGGAFNAPTWTRQTNTESDRNTATWQASDLGALAFLEYLHYDCGIPEGAMDAYYSPEGFATLLSNYESHTETADCGKNGLRLYEFTVVSHGADYLMRYWVTQTSPTRVAGLMLVFPASNPSKLAAYAGRLFPQLPTCAAAAG